MRDRAHVYLDFEILCYLNSTESTGWAVCKYIHDGLCSATEGTKRYEPVVGNGAFHRHVKMHNKKDNDSQKCVTIPADKKKFVIYSAAVATTMDGLPLNFWDKKQGMSKFAEALKAIIFNISYYQH